MTAISLAAIVACNNGTETETTDSTSTSMVTEGPADNTTDNPTVNINPDASYKDLKSGKEVKLRYDPAHRYVVYAETNEPVYYYIDMATLDTFDRSGVNVSNALTHGNDGMYSVDESKMKIKVQSDGDIKMKDEAGNKMKIEDDKIKYKSADGTKEKIDADQYKRKTDSTTTKIPR